MNWLDIPVDDKEYTLVIKKNYKPAKTLLESGIDTVNNITKTYPGPYYLMCSGGVDSQAMAYIWSKANVEFECITFLYTDHNGKFYNTHDIDTFHAFAKMHNISYKSKLFNYWQFLEQDIEKIALQYDCASPHITAYIAMSDKISNGTVIFSGNFFEYGMPPFDHDILGLYRYSKKCTTHRVIPFFLSYDKEIAFTKFSITLPTTHNYYQDKCQVYEYFGIPIIKQNTKLSGFEFIKDHFDTRLDLVTKQDKLKFSTQPSTRIFDIAYRYKLREKLGLVKSQIIY